MKKAFSTNELATLFDKNFMWVLRQAKKESWVAIPRSKKQGGNLWQISSMSKNMQDAIKTKFIASLPVEKMSPLAEIALKPFLKENFTEKQIKIRDARLYILGVVNEIAIDIGIRKTEILFENKAQNGGFETSLLNVLAVANTHNTGITSRTLRQWRTLKNKQGANALIPKSKKRIETLFPDWLPAMLEEFRKPSKPSIAQCYERLQLKGVELPTLRTVQRIMKNLGTVELQKGRMLPREHKRLTAFVRRDFSKLLPTDVYTADGHTVDMYVLHPIHGKPFRPEVTSIIDIATRACVGWSVSLNENSWGVADAIRMSVQGFGVPAIFYTDNGSGFKNKMLEAQNTGILVRLGISIEHSLPYASQARGVIERFQQVFIKGTRQFVGYAGKDMDKEALQLVYKIAQKEIKNTGNTRKFLSWEQFKDWVNETIKAYNNRIHSTINETPKARWERLIKQVEPITINQSEIDDLFKPYEIRIVARCEIRIFNSIYFSLNLENYHGEQVKVGYDIHDPSEVWVKDLEGRFITKAELNANSQDYFPMSVVEKARETRFEGKVQRLEAHKQTAFEEYHGKPIIETVALTPNQQAIQDDLIIEFDKEQDLMPIAVETKQARYKNALALQTAIENGEKISQEDMQKLENYKKTPEYGSMNFMYENWGEASLIQA